MRVLLVNDSASPHTGGMNRVVVETCDLLLRAGHDVALAYHDDHPVKVQCPVFHLPMTWPVAQRCAGLHDVVRQFQPQVVQSHSSKIVPALRTLSEDVPTCLFFHDLSWICSALDRVTRGYRPCHRPHNLACLAWHYALGCGGKNPLGNWQRWWEIDERARLASLKRARFQFASEFMRNSYVENGFSPEQIDVIPLFATPPPPTENKPEPGLMLLPSRLVPTKGVDIAIRAAATIKNTQWKLAIAGEGPERARLQTLAHTIGVGDRVTFLGEISPQSLAAWYDRSQLVLFPVCARNRLASSESRRLHTAVPLSRSAEERSTNGFAMAQPVFAGCDAVGRCVCKRPCANCCPAPSAVLAWAGWR
jgi:glycosyltransferase involved in cell wall biosynthesis